MSEIAKSFTFLHDSIPQWLEDLIDLEKKVAAMQESIVKMPVSVSPFAKQTTESVESIKHDRMGAIAEDAAPSQAAQTDVQANRKRKTLSVLSGRGSAPARYRPRAMVVVDYDGDMQKSFELLVRAIGTGRNLLRKAKMEAKMNELAALAGSSEDEDEADHDENDAIMAKISYRPRMSSMRARAAAGRAGRNGGGSVVTPVALFDTTDKTLEHAQVLCEKAAHVILRDGDCRTELGGMRKSFTDVFETAKIEVTKSAATKLLETQQTPSQDTSDTSLSSIEPSYKKHFPQLSQPPPEAQSAKNMLPTIPAATTPHAPLKTMEIEVDDDDEDDEEDFVMPVRFTSRFAVRA